MLLGSIVDERRLARVADTSLQSRAAAKGRLRSFVASEIVRELATLDQLRSSDESGAENVTKTIATNVDAANHLAAHVVDSFVGKVLKNAAYGTSVGAWQAYTRERNQILVGAALAVAAEASAKTTEDRNALVASYLVRASETHPLDFDGRMALPPTHKMLVVPPALEYEVTLRDAVEPTGVVIGPANDSIPLSRWVSPLEMASNRFLLRELVLTSQCGASPGALPSNLTLFWHAALAFDGVTPDARTVFPMTLDDAKSYFFEQGREYMTRSMLAESDTDPAISKLFGAIMEDSRRRCELAAQLNASAYEQALADSGTIGFQLITRSGEGDPHRLSRTFTGAVAPETADANDWQPWHLIAVPYTHGEDWSVSFPAPPGMASSVLDPMVSRVQLEFPELAAMPFRKGMIDVSDDAVHDALLVSGLSRMQTFAGAARAIVVRDATERSALETLCVVGVPGHAREALSLIHI